MKNNKEFKDLVENKYKSLNAKRTATRRTVISSISCLFVCVLVFGMVFGNRITPSNTGDTISQTDFLDTDIADSSKDSLQADKSNDSSSVIPDKKVESSLPEHSDEPSESTGDISDEASDEVSDEVPGGDPCDEPNDKPSYTIVPDDFPDICETTDLLQFLTANTPTYESSPFSDTDTRNGIANFSFELFKNSYTSGKNNLLSPTSAIYTMAMLTNGADGNTKEQLINTICGTDLDRLNEYMCEYRTLFGTGNGYNTHIDNSIWYDESVTVDKNFLQTNYDYYGIEAYKTIFSSQEALDSINGWISDKTNGLIDKFADKIEKDVEMAIVNTLYFEANWHGKLYSIENKTFTKENGEQKTVTQMYGQCNTYVSNDKCTGFIYKYEDKYSFVALLPNEDITVADLINSLNYTAFDELLSNKKNGITKFSFPKFQTDDEIELTTPLQKMGITDIFYGEYADFSKMAISQNGNLYTKSIKQVTNISVHEEGTLAAAATIAWEGPDSLDYVVTIDRPFVYIIFDNTTNLPIFIGTVEDF